MLVSGVALAKPAQVVEKRGPALEQAFDPSGALKPAGEGFFRSLGLAAPSLDAVRQGSIPQVEIRPLKGVDYLFSKIDIPGQTTATILATQLPALILNLDFPKKMRWSDLDITYARPLRWIVALLGPHVVPFVIGDLLSGRQSHGHRQLKGEEFISKKPAIMFRS